MYKANVCADFCESIKCCLVQTEFVGYLVLSGIADVEEDNNMKHEYFSSCGQDKDQKIRRAEVSLGVK